MQTTDTEVQVLIDFVDIAQQYGSVIMACAGIIAFILIFVIALIVLNVGRGAYEDEDFNEGDKRE